MSVTAFDPAGSWFEEPIVDGYSLPRCPNTLRRRAHERRAFEDLAVWLAATAKAASASGHADALLEAIRADAARMDSPVDAAGVIALSRRLALVMRAAHDVQLAVTHGDFQPGNVLVDRSRGEVFLTDWEYSGHRQASFDWFVYGLRARSGPGLADRVRRYVEEGDAGPCSRFVGASGYLGWRYGRLAGILHERLPDGNVR